VNPVSLTTITPITNTKNSYDTFFLRNIEGRKSERKKNGPELKSKKQISVAVIFSSQIENMKH